MHINVRDILVESVGYSRDYKISGERPQLESVRLTQDVGGELQISRLDEQVLVRGHASTEIELECHRCLRTFNRPTRVNFQQLYSEVPGDEDLPIIDGELDLAPLVEQEIILGLPIKILCQPDCKGIEIAGEKYTRKDSPVSLRQQARITKGTKRGRT
jgi:uncharacterized metal-binding protein YceD (DUF177 family)